MIQKVGIKIFIGGVIYFALASRCLASAPVLINEIYSNPLDGQTEWIELANLTPASIDLSGYTISDNTDKPVLLSGLSIPGDGFIVLKQKEVFSFSLNNGGDIVALRDNNQIVDTITFGNFDDGNKTDNAEMPAKGQTVARKIGASSGIDRVDFFVGEATPSAENLQRTYPNTILISEIAPTPGPGKEEFIELKNVGSTGIDLTNWSISDSSESATPFILQGVLEPNGYKVIYKSESHISLNDTGDSVRLFTPNGELQSQVNYDKAKANLSFYQLGAEWSWGEQTPGQSNPSSFVVDVVSGSAPVLTSTSTKAEVSGVVTVPPGVLSSQYGFFQNEEKALQFYSYNKDFPELKSGDIIDVTGEITYPHGEKRIKISDSSNLIVISHGQSAEAIELTNLDPTLLGYLVSCNGTISKKEDNGFILETKWGNILVKETELFPKKQFKTGMRLEVQGIFSVYDGSFRILPIGVQNVTINSQKTLPKAGEGNSIIISLAVANILWFIYQRVKKTQLS